MSEPKQRSSQGRQFIFLVLSWDIAETKLIGPYDTAEIAHGAITDHPDDYLENLLVLGPLPVSKVGSRRERARREVRS